MLFNIPLSVVWVVVAIIFGIMEAVSMGLTTIWFAIGALVAWILALMHVPVIIQIIIFLLVSSLLLYFTRPIAKKVLKIGHTKTNASSLIGEIGIVIEGIEPVHSKGQVKVNGQIWSAKSQDRKPIEPNSRVEILAIEGVKLVIKKID